VAPPLPALGLFPALGRFPTLITQHMLTASSLGGGARTRAPPPPSHPVLLLTPPPRQIGVASTKAYTSQILCMVLMALTLSEDSISKRELRDSIIDELGQLPGKVRPSGARGGGGTGLLWRRVAACQPAGLWPLHL